MEKNMSSRKESRMKIFAIDPGNEFSAYCIMDDEYKLDSFAKLSNRELMEVLLSRLNDVDLVVIERMQSYGMPVGKETFEACEWIGRYAQEAEKKVPVEYIFRQEEKLWICHDTRAKDTNIRLALIERFAQHDFLTGQIPVSRWVLILMLLALVVDVAVMISHLSRKKIPGEELNV